MKHDLDQMLRNIEHTEPGAVFGVTLQGSPARPRHPRLARRLLPVASALLLLTLIVTLSIIALQREDTTPDLPPDDGENTLPPDTDPAPVDPAPWESGKLRVTSLTYRETRESAHFAPTDAPALIPLSEVSSTVQSENIAISLAFGTPISGCGNANLLRISPTEGEHADCDAVYYHIREDEIYCLSCTLKEEIAEHPLYLDAWVRAIIEEGLLVKEDAEPANRETFAKLYRDLYDTMVENDVYDMLTDGERLSIVTLGLTEVLNTYRHLSNERYNWPNLVFAVSNLEPQIYIIEHGMQENKCTFALLSTYRPNLCYGNYVYDFSTGELLRLEGQDTQGQHPHAQYDGIQYAFDLTQAHEIQISKDYTTMVATMPAPQSYTTVQNELFSPRYAIDTRLVVVYDLVNGGVSVNFRGNEKYQTEQRATIQNGVIFYINTHSQLCLITPDGRLLETEHILPEVDRILHTEDDSYTILRYNEGKYAEYHYLRLSDGADVTTAVMNGEISLPEHAYFVFDGLVRIDTRTKERTVLLEEQGSLHVCSEDERYLYFLAGDSKRIFCLDRYDGTSAQIPLHNDFYSQLANMDNIRLLLFLSRDESTLTLTYTVATKLSFDAEGFHEQVKEEIKAHPNYTLFRDEFSPNFNITDTALLMLQHFYNGSVRMSFDDPITAQEILLHLLQRELCDYYKMEPKPLPDLAGQVEMVAHAAQCFSDLLVHDGAVASLKENAKEILKTDDALDAPYYIRLEYFYEVSTNNSTILYTVPKAEIPAIKEAVARALAQRAVYLVTGYTQFYMAPIDTEDPASAKGLQMCNRLYELMAQQINRNMDETQMQALIDTLTQESLQADRLKHIQSSKVIDDYYLYYNPRDLQAEMLQLLPLLARELGIDYGELILQTLSPREYEHIQLIGVYNPTCYHTVTGVNTLLERAEIVVVLQGVTFAPGELSLRRQAAIYEPVLGLELPGESRVGHGTLPFALLYAGYDEDGNYYLESNGYFAAISKEQYLAFTTLCGERSENAEDDLSDASRNYSDLYEQCSARAREEVYGSN